MHESPEQAPWKNLVLSCITFPSSCSACESVFSPDIAHEKGEMPLVSANGAWGLGNPTLTTPLFPDLGD